MEMPPVDLSKRTVWGRPGYLRFLAGLVLGGLLALFFVPFASGLWLAAAVTGALCGLLSVMIPRRFQNAFFFSLWFPTFLGFKLFAMPLCRSLVTTLCYGVQFYCAWFLLFGLLRFLLRRRLPENAGIFGPISTAR